LNIAAMRGEEGGSDRILEEPVSLCQHENTLQNISLDGIAVFLDPLLVNSTFQ
jgi:hypothetical protein